MSPGDRVVRAAGVVPVRLREGVLQVALVHRAKYDDWSWPKGKLDHGEDFPVAAVRETLEETGLRVRLTRPLPDVRYRLQSSAQTKLVRYWVGEVVGGHGRLEHEIDEVAWLSPTLAARRLSYDHDQGLLDAVVRLHHEHRLGTWPLLLVRHAHSVSRSDWDRPDDLRPLSRAGRRRAEGRMRLLTEAYSPAVALSSPAVRCTDTLRPWSEAAGVPVVSKKGLSEEGFSADPTKVDKHLARLLEAGDAAVVCTHGPLLPRLLHRLGQIPREDLDVGDRRILMRLRDVPMDKGEILVCTMLGTGDDARVVAVERHRPRGEGRETAA